MGNKVHISANIPEAAKRAMVLETARLQIEKGEIVTMQELLELMIALWFDTPESKRPDVPKVWDDPKKKKG